MKKGSENLISKYVYRQVPFRGGFWRRTKFTDCLVSLGSEFSACDFIARNSNKFKINYVVDGEDITCWIDKHGNIIVRVIHNNIKQTKINF